MTYGTRSDSAGLRTEDLELRVDRARKEYENVMIEVRRLMKRAEGLGLASPEGLTAIGNATRLQDEATRRYAEALRALSDSVLGRWERELFLNSQSGKRNP